MACRHARFSRGQVGSAEGSRARRRLHGSGGGCEGARAPDRASTIAVVPALDAREGEARRAARQSQPCTRKNQCVEQSRPVVREPSGSGDTGAHAADPAGRREEQRYLFAPSLLVAPAIDRRTVTAGWQMRDVRTWWTLRWFTGAGMAHQSRSALAGSGMSVDAGGGEGCRTGEAHDPGQGHDHERSSAVVVLNRGTTGRADPGFEETAQDGNWLAAGGWRRGRLHPWT